MQAFIKHLDNMLFYKDKRNIKNLSNSDTNHCVIPFPPIEMFLKENASWKLRIRASWLDFWKTKYKQVINNSLV